MRNYVIINGVNSLTIQGLAIKTLPPITKPIQRNLREEIDGRDGDIVTTLGYGAYDKTIEIGLFGTFDIDEVIAYFNQKGTITFSNEADKVYYFEALDQVDYAELLKFRTANVVLHCQPFKYPLNETPLVEEYEYVEATGSNVTLDNTSEAIFNKIDLQGNTEQTQYTGINLFSTDAPSKTQVGLTVTNNGDGTYSISGTTTANVSIPLTIASVGQALTGGQPYTMGVEIISNGGSGGTLTMAILKNGTTQYNFFTISPQSATGMKVQTATPSEDATIREITYYAGSGAVINNLKIRPYLVKGSYTASTIPPYEPYVGGTPSPNPNYPQDIHVVSGDNVVEITGKNIFDKDNINSIDAYFSTGVTTITNNSSNKIIYVPCQPNATYTMQKINSAQFYVGYTHETPANGVQVYGIDNTSTIFDTNYKYITFTTDANSKYIVARVYQSAQDTQITFQEICNTIQIEKGNKTEYEPYTGETYPINLGSLEMASIPNTEYKDIFVKEGETWYKRAMLKKVIYDGTETGWGMSTWGTQPYKRMSRDVADIKQIADSEISPIISNQFRAGKYNDGSLNTITSRGSIHQLNLWQDVATANVSAWTTWLSTHNLIVYYPLDEGTDIEITNETLANQLEAIKNAISYKGQTNISQTNNDMPFILDLSALKENSDHLVIDNIGNIYSKPTLDLEGTGIVDIYLNDTQMFEVDLSEKNEIVIDTQAMEAYNPTDNTLANRQVTGDYSKFKLDSGENDLRFSGNLTKATITNYERWL